MKFLLPIFLFFYIPTFAGNHYTHSSTSGSITISQTTDGHTLAGDDTLDLNSSGVYNMVQAQGINGTPGHYIVIRGNGARSTQSSFQQPVWYNISYVKFINLVDSNWYGLHKFSNTIHDVVFDYCRVVNISGHYSNQPYWQWDDASASPDMVFAGSKSKTFYNITVSHCRWEGFLDNSTTISIGSNWGGGTEPKRSIALDWLFDSDTVQNTFNTQIGTSGTGSTMDGIFGTGWGIVFNKMVFNRILPKSGAYGNSHTAGIVWYGSSVVKNCKMDSSYAQLARITPLGWNGLAGYIGNGTASYQFNNIDHNKYSYSSIEVNQNNLGNRTPTNGVYPTRDTCVHNTIYRTVGHSYNPPPSGSRYAGMEIDNANQDTLFAEDNYIMAPEYDFTYRPDLRNNYSVYYVSSADPDSTNINNKSFATWSTSITDDTVSYIPASGSALENAGHAFSFRTTDFFGNPMNGTPDIGAVERQSSGSPPSCTTNILPLDGGTVVTSNTAVMTWNVEPTATYYDIFGPYTGGTPPGTPTYSTSLTFQIATNLTPGAVYHYYVRPGNIYGTATGCATSKTQFSEGQTVVPYKIYRSVITISH